MNESPSPPTTFGTRELMPAPSRRRWFVSRQFIFVAVLLNLYLLGAGPVTWLDSRGYLTGNVRKGVEFVYSPISLAMDHWNWVDEVVETYLEFWD